MAVLGGLFEGNNEPLSHTCGERLKRCNRRTGGAVFDPADVGLADTGLLGEFLLCHVLCNSCGNQRARYFKLRTHGFVFFPKLRIFHLLCFVLAELTEKSRRLDELNAELNMDQRENEIADGETPQEETEQERDRELTAR